VKLKATCYIARQANINACTSVRYPIYTLYSQASSPFSERWKPPYQIWKYKTGRHKLK